MRVLMTGGGTGGHINPALAIAKIIEQNEPDSVIAFVGTPNGMESTLIPKAGYDMYHIEISGFKRGKIFANFRTAWLMFTSVIKAKKIIREFKPDVCIGTGGYVSWPLIKAAQKLHVPTAMHESNALAGMAVKAVAPGLGVLFTNFESTGAQTKCRNVIRTGNPLRKDFGKIGKEEAKKQLGIDGYVYSVLSFGGSLGADAVNNAVLDTMKSYCSVRNGLHHLHQTGSRNFVKVSARFDELGLGECPNLAICDYIHDMPYRMAAADVVIARAGAMTVSELAAMGKPAILIPSPNVTDNHQFRNAFALAEKGACILIEEKDLSGEVLAREIESVLADREKREKMSAAIRGFHVGNTDELIYNGIKELIG